jgi:hypothetical protein
MDKLSEVKDIRSALSGRVTIKQKALGTRIIAELGDSGVRFMKKNMKDITLADILLGDNYDVPIEFLKKNFFLKNGARYFFTYCGKTGRMFLDDSCGDRDCELRSSKGLELIAPREFSYDALPDDILSILESGGTVKLSKAMDLEKETHSIILEANGGRYLYKVKSERRKKNDFTAFDMITADIVKYVGINFFNTVSIADTKPDVIFVTIASKMFRYYYKKTSGALLSSPGADCASAFKCDVQRKADILSKFDSEAASIIMRDKRSYSLLMTVMMMLSQRDWSKNRYMADEDREKMAEIHARVSAICRDNILAISIPSLEDLKIYK